MTTLEDKVLYGKPAGYCSSSSDEDDETSRENVEKPRESSQYGSSIYTGPKGVLEDWRRYKQLESENCDNKSKELLDLSKKFALTCRTCKEDEDAKAKEDQEELFNEALSDEDFLKEYMKNRMLELQHTMQNRSRCNFGVIFDLDDTEAYLRATESDSMCCTVLIHLYENQVDGCDAVHGCFLNLAKRFPSFKFCRVKASILGTSEQFLKKALPAVQAYREGQLIGNFVRLTDELGHDFFTDDLESFLNRCGILPDSNEI